MDSMVVVVPEVEIHLAPWAVSIKPTEDRSWPLVIASAGESMLAMQAPARRSAALNNMAVVSWSTYERGWKTRNEIVNYGEGA
jgi:hypothetical protein